MYTPICMYIWYIYTHTSLISNASTDISAIIQINSGSYRIKWLGQMVPTVQLDAETPKTDAHVESKYIF